MKTRAAVVNDKCGRFEVSEVELAELRDDEVLVRIAGVGVCHTDLICRDQLYPVRFPALFGHEGSGVVEKVGARVAKVQPGDHVVLTFRACGQCTACKRGDPTHCPAIFGCNFGGTRADGSATVHHHGVPIFGNFFGQSSFAAYALANEANTVKVPKEAPIELLGPLGCGIQTGAGAVLNTFKPDAGSSIAVFGCGSVGLSAIMAANAVDFPLPVGPHTKTSPRESLQNFSITDGKFNSWNVGMLVGIWRNTTATEPRWRKALPRNRPIFCMAKEKSASFLASKIFRCRMGSM